MYDTKKLTILVEEYTDRAVKTLEHFHDDHGAIAIRCTFIDESMGTCDFLLDAHGELEDVEWKHWPPRSARKPALTGRV